MWRHGDGARKLVEMGAQAGDCEGRAHGEGLFDVLFDGKEMHHLGGDRVKVENTHGGGARSLGDYGAAGGGRSKLLEETTLAKAYVNEGD